MWYKGMSIEQVINHKVFVYEVVEILIAFISSVIIIPVTAYISSKVLLKNKYKDIVDNIKGILSDIFSE